MEVSEATDLLLRLNTTAELRAVALNADDVTVTAAVAGLACELCRQEQLVHAQALFTAVHTCSHTFISVHTFPHPAEGNELYILDIDQLGFHPGQRVQFGEVVEAGKLLSVGARVLTRKKEE